jgi:hypothetical protein
LINGTGQFFSEDLPDIQLQQLLEIFNELEKHFKEYIVQQIKQLAETLKKAGSGIRKRTGNAFRRVYGKE